MGVSDCAHNAKFVDSGLRLSDECRQQVHSLVRKSGFGKAQGLHETGPRGLVLC